MSLRVFALAALSLLVASACHREKEDSEPGKRSGGPPILAERGAPTAPPALPLTTEQLAEVQRTNLDESVKSELHSLANVIEGFYGQHGTYRGVTIAVLEAHGFKPNAGVIPEIVELTDDAYRLRATARGATAASWEFNSETGNVARFDPVTSERAQLRPRAEPEVQREVAAPAPSPSAIRMVKLGTKPTPAPKRPETPSEIVAILAKDPGRATDVEPLLDALVAGGVADDATKREMFEAYVRLASYLRFTVGDSKHATKVYEKARPFALAVAREILVDLAIADVSQFELNKPKDALRHLRRVLDSVTTIGAGDRRAADSAEMAKPLADWLRAEIRFLETGNPFTGTITSAASSVIGFFVMSSHVFAVDPGRSRFKPSFDAIVDGMAGPKGRRPDPEVVAKSLAALPPSRAMFLTTAGFLQFLRPEDVLAHLERQDPARYLSAVVLTVGAAEDHAREVGRRVGRPSLLSPLEGEPYVRSSLRLAAERFPSRSGIRIEAPATDPELSQTLIALWQGMIDALKAGDIEQAVSRITPGKRESYRRIFSSLDIPLSDIETIFSREISMVRIHAGRAEFQMIRIENGTKYSYPVIFARDADGVWRIKSL